MPEEDRWIVRIHLQRITGVLDCRIRLSGPGEQSAICAVRQRAVRIDFEGAPYRGKGALMFHAQQVSACHRPMAVLVCVFRLYGDTGMGMRLVDDLLRPW